MKLTSKPLAILIVVLMFGGIFISSLAGWWETESTKQAAAYTAGEFAGQANPADIRGSYTFGDVEKNFNVPAALLAQAFGIQTDNPAAFAVKELEALYADSSQEVGTASVRLFVAFYLGLPIDLSTDMYLPESAAEVLRSRNLSTENAAYLEAHLATAPGSEPPAAEATATPAAANAPEDAAPAATATPAAETATKPADAGTPKADASAEHTPVVEEGVIKGKTTFADLLAWGLPAETIEQVLGIPMPAAPGITVKDFCTQNNLDLETIKPALQAELDKLK